MWFVTVASLACFGVTVNGASIDCPTPRSPENGYPIFFYSSTTVKYNCFPGYILKGQMFSYCKDEEWSSEPPLCLPEDVMVEDPVASYDYSCYQADARGRATLIRPPRISNSGVTYNRSKNSNSPYNDYLTAVYRCNPGFRMRDSRFDVLHCTHRAWYGKRPVCDPTDIDECEVENFGCSGKCINTPGSAHCFCEVGYELKDDQKTCVDIDECEVENFGCSGKCINIPGSAHCFCEVGYELKDDQKTCVDIDECEVENFGCSGECINTPGSAHCFCEVGYELKDDQKTCVDIDECLEKNGNCSHTCNNFPGGYNCSCDAGHRLDSSQKQCTAVGCPPIDTPPNGKFSPPSCTTSGGEVRQKCYMTCNPGFQLVGKRVFTCTRTLKWEPEEFPTCEAEILPHVDCLPDITTELPAGKSSIEIQISPPSSNMRSEYITVSPSWVKTGNVTFPAGTTDIIYTVRNPRTLNAASSCTRTVKVIDKEAPQVFDCPSPLAVDSSVADSSQGALRSWKEPTFEDNVGVVSITKSMERILSLSPGVHFMKYVAKDAEGNVAECVFHTHVTDAECKDPTKPVNGDSNCLDWVFGKICKPMCHPGYVFYYPKPTIYACGISGGWSPSNEFQNCTKFIPANNSECLPGMELTIHHITKEEICVECPFNMLWSSSTKTCADIDSSSDGGSTVVNVDQEHHCI